MTDFLTLHSIAEAATAGMITCLMGGFLVTLVVWLLLWVSSCGSSVTRFAVWFATLLGIAGLCFVSCLAGGTTKSQPGAHVTLPASWAFAAFLLWAAGAGLGLLRIACGLQKLRSIRRGAEEIWPGNNRLHRFAADSGAVSPEATANLAELKQMLGEFPCSRRISVCISQDVRVPTAIGFFRPAVLIPAWALKEVSAAELRTILLHELGHLRRRDDWTNLVQKVLRALLFFHPAVWWVDSRASLEREIACDDLVLANTADPREYAQCLVSVAEKGLVRKSLTLAVAAVDRMAQTALRLTRILDRSRLHETRISKAAFASITAVSLAGVAALPHVPTFVKFENKSDNQMAVRSEAATVEAVQERTDIRPKIVKAVAHQDWQKTESFAKAELRTAGLRESGSSRSSTPKLVRREQKIQRRANRLDASSLLLRTNWSGEQVDTPTILILVQTTECDGTSVYVFSVGIWQVPTTSENMQVKNGTASKVI